MDELLKLLQHDELPAPDLPGTHVGWFPITSLALSSGELWAGDPEFSWAELTERVGFRITLPAGEYDVLAFLMAYGPWHGVARLRVCQHGIAEPAIGDEVGQAGTDSALMGVCDAHAVMSAFQAKFGSDGDAAPLDLANHNFGRVGVLQPNGPNDAGIVYVNCGFGDGQGPIYALRNGEDRVGVEFVFIESGSASP